MVLLEISASDRKTEDFRGFILFPADNQYVCLSIGGTSSFSVLVNIAHVTDNAITYSGSVYEWKLRLCNYTPALVPCTECTDRRTDE